VPLVLEPSDMQALRNKMAMPFNYTYKDENEYMNMVQDQSQGMLEAKSRTQMQSTSNLTEHDNSNERGFTLSGAR
jgi:hypothetical protein